MKVILLYPAVIGVALLMAGCNPIAIDADIPDRGGLITITSLFAADSIWSVSVDLSKGIRNAIQVNTVAGLGKTDIEPIINAQVTIRENGQILDNLVYNYYFPAGPLLPEFWSYRSSKPEIRPTAGNEYSITVTVQDLGTAVSTCFIPSPVRLILAKADTTITTIHSESIENNQKNPYATWHTVPAEVVIDDPAGENFYELFVKFKLPPKSAYWAAQQTYTKDLQFHNTGLSPSSQVISGQDNLYYPVIFSDRDMHAKQLKLTLMMPVVIHSVGGKLKMFPGVGYTLVLRTLSKEYFEYISSQELQIYSFQDPFAQPVVVYGNIQGGLGIFAGFSENAMDVEF